MLLIPCPWCGERSHIEFVYGGDATRRRPDTQGPVAAADWHAYVYLRDNRRGAHVEYWHHSHGCRKWIKVRRDTLTHAILGAEDPNGAGGKP